MHSHLWNAKQIKSNARRLDPVILLIMAIRSQWGIANILLPNLMKLRFLHLDFWDICICQLHPADCNEAILQTPIHFYGAGQVYAISFNPVVNADQKKVYIRSQPPHTGQLEWLSVIAKAVQLKAYGGVVSTNLCKFTGFYPKGQISPCLIELQM